MERLDKAALNALQPPEFRYFLVRLGSRGRGGGGVGSGLACAAGNGGDEPGGLRIRPLRGLLRAPEEGWQLAACSLQLHDWWPHLSFKRAGP